MHLCSGRAWRLQSWSCCALQNQAVVCFLCRGLTRDNTGHGKGRSTSHRGLGGTLKKNMKESKTTAPEVALPCPRGSRWENVKVPVWKLNSWPAGYYQLLLNIETSREEEEDYVLVRKRKMKRDMTHLTCRPCVISLQHAGCGNTLRLNI